MKKHWKTDIKQLPLIPLLELLKYFGKFENALATKLKNSEFSEILNYMENYFQIREKIEVNSNYHDKIIENIKNNLMKKYSEVDTRDGVKAIIDENSWILIRKSNTEDIIRISGESNNKEKCKKIINDTIEMVKEYYDKVK